MGEKMKKSCAVNFVGWKQPLRDWEPLILRLSSAHHSTWKSAGIYEAIMCSKYAIKRHQELIFELASRWRSETNTFVFPWGEATLTLEDMLVLGGFSSFGLSALTSTSLEGDPELLNIESQLEQAIKEMNRSKSKKALQGKWMAKFVNCGDDLEHVAFLALWLSRFVCPMGGPDIINKFSFPIAIKLSRGVRIAIGPAVLATMYKELTALSERLKGENFERLDLYAPFQLLQIWAWERYPTLKPNSLNSDGDFPRVARWGCVNISKDKDLVFALDCAGKSFGWCPYGAIDLDLFPRFMETSEVVGFDSCIEKYSPCRVARQFGLDQDLPDDDRLKDADRGRGYTKSSQIELVVIQDSDSDEDYDDDDDEDELTIRQLLKRAAGSKGLLASSSACPDVKQAVMAESVREDEKTGCDKKTDDLNVTVPQDQESFDSSNETAEEMIFMNISEDDKAEAERTNTGFLDAEGSDLQNEFGMSYQHAREEESLDFDLEARISRLEKKVEGLKSRLAVPRQE